MRGRGVRTASIAALCVLGLLVGFLVTRPIAQIAIQVDSPLLGTRAPAFTATSLQGAKVSLQTLRGRVVVLSFFASWCAACGTEAPRLVTYAWHEHVTHAAASVLGVVYNDNNGAVASFARAFGITFPVLADPGGALANAFAVASPPVTVVIDRTGHVAAVLQGPVTSSQLVAITDHALGRGA